MQKNKFIELVSRHILGNDSSVDRKYQADKRIIELDISAAFNTIIYQIFRKEPSNLDRYVKVYKDVAVSLDADTGQYYSTLPASVIQFPTTCDGIWNISEMEGVGVQFVPMSRKNNKLFAGSEFDLIDDVIKYNLIGSTVEYYNFDTDITLVKMDLVVAFTEWGSTEDVPLPSGQDLNIINIVRELNGLRPIDKLDNQNSVA